MEGIVLGTPAFIAPERVRGVAYDGRSDVYGVAAMVYRMLSGQLPFADTVGDPQAMLSAKLTSEPVPLRALDPAIPAAVETVVMRALSLEPRQRPGAGTFAEQLARLG
jgi:serine/threonine protein kinase